MSVQIPKNFGEGGGGVLTACGPDSLDIKGALNRLATDVAALMDAFNSHKHRFDGTQGTNSVTSNAVTGTASGTVASGGTDIADLTPSLTPSDDYVAD